MSKFLPIGQELAAERKRLGFNQTDFAELAGITRKTLFGYESGERAPDVAALLTWASHGLDLELVLTGTTKKLRSRLNAVKVATELSAIAAKDDAERQALQEQFFKALVQAYDSDSEEEQLLDDYRRCTSEDKAVIRQMAARFAGGGATVQPSPRTRKRKGE